MSKAETCVCCGRVIPENSHYCVICGMEQPKKQRQIDRIRNMSKLELAHFLSELQWEATNGKSKYPYEWEKYLESEVDAE